MHHHLVKRKPEDILWNLLTLALLINILTRAIRVTPYFYNPILFSQPNMAVFHFPYILLPPFVVPLILFCHLSSLYQLFFLKVKEE